MAPTIWPKMCWKILSARYLAMRCPAFVSCGGRMSYKIYIYVYIYDMYLSCVEWFLMALTMPDICCRNLEFNISSFMILFGALHCHRHTMDAVGDGSCSIRAIFTVLSSGRWHWHRSWRANR